MHFDAVSQVAFLFVVIFLVIAAYFGVFRKVGSSLDKRAARIAHELDEARRLRAEAEELVADYRRKAEEAGREAEAIVARAREDAARAKADAERSLAETIERRTRAAETKITQAEVRALADVRSVAADVAVAAAERVLRERAGRDLGAALIDRSIRDLGTRLN